MKDKIKIVTLRDHIEQHFTAPYKNEQFAKQQGVSKQTVYNRLNSNCIVINGILYTPAWTLKK